MRDRTHYLLIQYARWCRFFPGRVASSSLIFLDANVGSTVPEPDISDDDALKINSALVSLALENANYHDVVCKYYLQEYPKWRIEQLLGLSKQRVSVMLDSGVMFVDGCLSNMKAVA